jgi:hypothetical protein
MNPSAGAGTSTGGAGREGRDSNPANNCRPRFGGADFFSRFSSELHKASAAACPWHGGTAGHVHRATLTLFARTAATICPALNYAVALDLVAQLPPSFLVEPPAFHLHAWFPGARFGELVTHLVPIGHFDGPHPFFDAEGRQL